MGYFATVFFEGESQLSNLIGNFSFGHSVEGLEAFEILKNVFFLFI